MKKWSIVLIVAMLAAFGLSACGGKDEGEKAGTKDKVIELKFTAWGDVNSNGPEAQLAEEFNKNHDDIKVVFEPVPGDGYGTKLTTSLASGTAPDVFLIGEGDFYTYVDKGAVEPLDSYLENDNSFSTDVFQQELLNMGNIHDKLYYLPKDFNPISLWYNKTMFDEAGLAYPDDSWTWDDLIDTAKKLTVKDDNGKYTQFGFNAGTWQYPIYTYLWAHGTSISNEDGTQAEGFLNNEKTIKAMENYVNFSIGSDRVSPTPQDTETLGGDSSMFMTNKLGMMITGRWVKGDLDKSDIEYGTAMIPKGPEGERAGIIAAAGWAVNSKGKNKEAAYELAKWLSGPEAQKIRAKDGKVLPATLTDLEEVKSTEVSEKAVIDMMDYAKKPVTMLSSNGPIFVEEFGNAMEKVLLKKSSVEDAFNEAAANVDEKN